MTERRPEPGDETDARIAAAADVPNKLRLKGEFTRFGGEFQLDGERVDVLDAGGFGELRLGDLFFPTAGGGFVEGHAADGTVFHIWLDNWTPDDGFETIGAERRVERSLRVAPIAAQAARVAAGGVDALGDEPIQPVEALVAVRQAGAELPHYHVRGFDVSILEIAPFGSLMLGALARAGEGWSAAGARADGRIFRIAVARVEDDRPGAGGAKPRRSRAVQAERR